MSKLKEWRKEFDEARATDGMKIVNDIFMRKGDLRISIRDACSLSFRIDCLLRTACGEERNRCYAVTHSDLMRALDTILKGESE